MTFSNLVTVLSKSITWSKRSASGARKSSKNSKSMFTGLVLFILDSNCCLATIASERLFKDSLSADCKSLQSEILLHNYQLLFKYFFFLVSI